MAGPAPLGLGQLRAVFERHADRHMTVPLAAPSGVTAWWRAGRIEVTVEDAKGPVVLVRGAARTEVQPDSQGRASLALRVGPGDPAVELRSGPGTAPILLLPPDPQSVARARRAHIRQFAATLGKALPAGLRWLSARHDPGRVAALRDALGLAHVTTAALLDPSRLTPAPARPPAHPPALPDRPVVIVLPVHNARALLAEALDRLEAHTDLPFDLVVIEDASTDPEVRPFLRERLSRFSGAKVTLIENPANLGFVASANLGLAVAQARNAHVILLNSDVFVPPRWASRLMAPLLAQPDRVASVTPLSAASGLTTVPMIGPGRPLPVGLADHVDRLAEAMSGSRSLDLPTGMGFCMAMSASFLARLPQFDPVFGAGYGEETDWCARAARLNGRHLAVPGLFVDHRGSASFGAEVRDRRAIAAAALIRARHPDYEARVARFVEADPLLTERMALGICLLGGIEAEGALSLYLAHALGGGAEADLQARLALHRGAGQPALVLRVGGVTRWGLELMDPDGVMVRAMTDETDVVRTLLRPLARRRLIYSCGVGDRDPASLPRILLSLLTGAEDQLTVLLQDHFPISPSFTLLGSDGWYHGVPAEDSDDPVHQARRPGGKPASLADWRSAWGALLHRADRIIAFSDSSARLLQQAYPSLPLRPEVQPHPVAALPGPKIQPGGRVLGILGNIRLHKGAGVVQALARMHPDLRLVLIGSLDPSLSAPPNLRVLGAYRREDILPLAREHGIGAWLIPSVWPETFCFALHEAMDSGLPVLGFDLGAQGEALRGAQAAGRPCHALPPGDGPAEAAAQVYGALRRIGLV